MDRIFWPSSSDNNPLCNQVKRAKSAAEPGFSCRRRSRAQNLPEDQAQIERTDVNQQSHQKCSPVLGDAFVSFNPGFVVMGEGALDQLTAPLQEMLGVAPLHSPPVRIRRLPFFRLAFLSVAEARVVSGMYVRTAVSPSIITVRPLRYPLSVTIPGR